jgi:hypothetical protein
MNANKLTLGHGCGFRIESSFTANAPLNSKKGYTTVSGLWYFPNYHHCFARILGSLQLFFLPTLVGVLNSYAHFVRKKRIDLSD